MKSKTQNSKSETISKIPMNKTVLNIFSFDDLNLFRISRFRFRICFSIASLIAISAYCCISLTSCKHDPIIPDTPAVSFKSDIQPIIIGNCTADGCHGSVNQEEFSLLTYDEVISGGEEGGVNKIYEVIIGRGEELMPPPPKHPLSDEQVSLIYLWIKQGAKNN